jgi:MFS family permease
MDATPSPPVSRRTDLRLLIPLLVSTLLIQLVTAMVRITTSYRAVELHLSTVWLGVISAAFALVPIMIALRVGRFIDRGNDAQTAWIGSALFFVGCGAIALSSSPTELLISTTVLGAGHLMLMASQQMLCVRAANPANMETVFGNYMVAGAIGQGIGPFVVGLVGGSATVPPTPPLFLVGVILAALALAVALTMRPGPKISAQVADAERVTVASLVRIPGLVAVVVAGVIMVSASDIMIVYVPLLGAERGIDVSHIGWLLTARAAASMVARLFYARLVLAVGRWPLIIWSTTACAASYAAFAAPISLAPMIVTICVMGFSFGLATTLSITMVVDMTTAGAQGTANSLRIMGNRIGQFALPFGAGVVAAAMGLPALFLLTASAIAVTAGMMRWSKGRQ